MPWPYPILHPLVRHIATQKTLAESSNQRSCFKPYQEVIPVMHEDPGSNRKQLMKSVKARISAEDQEHRIKHCQSLSIQGQTMHLPLDRAPVLWSTTVTKLPEYVFKFALNATMDTLPHNANLHLWKKSPSPTCKLCPEKQTLSHVLNSCSTALNHHRFNLRHDSVLKDLYLCLKPHLPNGSKLTVDLPDTEYSFPQHIVTTDLRPDLVIWNDTSKSIIIIELTIAFETAFEHARERKRFKYSNLERRCQRTQN